MRKRLFFFIIYYFLITLILLIFNPKSQFFHKNVDNFFLKFTKIGYQQISSYLNSKYDNQNYEIMDKTRKKIKINFVDYKDTGYQTPQINRIKKLLSERYDIEIDQNNPNYIFYNVFSCEHVFDEKYNNSIKIAYYTENIIPDLSDADYMIANHHINYMDRYLKYSYVFGLRYQFNDNKFKIVRQRIIHSSIKNKKFCAAVITNHQKYSSFRLKFINKLDKYKRIDMGGKFHNNVGFIKDKISFLMKYKFSIAMENTNGSGYVSEKIVQSFLSGTIPIYYGDYMIDEFINPKAFILIRDESEIKNKIEYIKKIDNDEKLFKKILNETIFINQEDIIKKNEGLRKQFLYNIFGQDYNKARRKDNYHHNL